MRLHGVVFLGLLILVFMPVVHASYVPYMEEWSIYELDLESSETHLIFTNQNEILTLAVHPDGSKLAYCVNHGEGYNYTEIYTMNVDGSEITRLTDNAQWDLYPNWSPDGSEITFLSWRNTTLDIWRMNADGSGQRLIYDSGGHDSDINWRDDQIAFTRDSQIWVMNSDGSDPRQLTDPPRAAEWGNAVLPFGDYDPRISPDGSTIVFERLVNDTVFHGMYDLFLVDFDGSNERQLTDTQWSQGIACWSPDGTNIVYLVAGMGFDGKYDIFRINVDGSEMTDLTSEIYPTNFLARAPKYSTDGSSIYFVGQWFGWEKLDSSISCAATPSTVQLGEAVTVSGSVDPLVHDLEYTITVTEPDGSENTDIISSTDGSYSYTFTPGQVGDYPVQVEWSGDLGHQPSSGGVSFTVQEVEEPSGGIPGFQELSLLLGVLSLTLFQRRRR